MSTRPPRSWPWILIPVVAAVAVAAIAIVGFLTFGAARPWPWWGFFPWFPFVGIWAFFGFLFLFGAFRWSAGPWDRSVAGPRDESHVILRERYARGELTRAQFEEMRRALDEHLTHNAYEDNRAGRAGP